MKCSVCGKEIVGNMRFCTNCGSPVKIQPKPTQPKPPQPKPYQPPKREPFEPKAGVFHPASGEDRTPKAMIIIIAILIAAIAGIGGFLIASKMSSKNNNEQPPAAAVTDTDEIDSEEEAIDEEEVIDEEEEEIAEAESIEEIPSVTMEYAHNAICDPENNLTEDDFERITSEDGTFFFSYPKYVFNDFTYIDENNYYYSYVENGETVAYMHVYAVEDAGDAVSIMTYRQQYLLDSLYDHGPKTYVYPDNPDKISFGKDEFVQIVISGWKDAAQREADYICVANDGQRSYYIDFMYPDSDPNNDKEYWDYIVNCTYHLCSFSGSSRGKAYVDYDDFYKNAYN